MLQNASLSRRPKGLAQSIEAFALLFRRLPADHLGERLVEIHAITSASTLPT